MRAHASARADVVVKAAFALALIWTLAGAGVMAARSARPTVASTIAFLRAHRVETLAPDERAEAMRGAASRLNQLNYAQLREVRNSRALFIFYRPLLPVEKERFAAMTVPTELRRLLDASRHVPAERHAAFLGQGLYVAGVDLTIAEPPLDPAVVHRIVRDALTGYFAGLDAGAKLELEPQVRQMRELLEPRE